MCYPVNCPWKTLLATIALGCFISTSSAQRIIPRFETLSVNDGLSQNSVYSIHQDKKGFMWFGTSNGLNRYDGETVKVFRAKSPPLEKANINFIRGNLCEDKRGRIWYANETGIYYFDPQKEEVNQAYNLMADSSNTITYYSLIFLDENENLWLSHPSVGLLSFSTDTQKLQEFPFSDISSKTDFDADPDHIGNSILLFLPQTKSSLKFDVITHTYQWLSTGLSHAEIISDGKYLYDVNDQVITPHDTLGPPQLRQSIKVQGKIRSILSDQFERIWITTLSDGLFCYYPALNKTERYHHETSKLKSLPFNITDPLFLDATNNLWIGTDGGGVARLDLKPPRFNIFPFNQGEYPFLKDYFIRCLFEDNTGRIWFGTLHNGLCIYNPKDGTIKNFIHTPGDEYSLPTDKVNVIFQDDKHTMIIGQGKGISIFDEAKNKFTNISLVRYSDQGLPTIEITKLMQEQNGDLLVGSSIGVFRLRTTKAGYEVNYLRELNISSTDILQMPSGDLWMTSRERGLNYFKYTEREYENEGIFFKGVNLRSIHRDEQNPEIIWLCSGAGLIRFNTQTHEYKLYNEENGMPDNYLYGILEDGDHNFWMSSNTGIYVFNPRKEEFINYSVKDGLQSNEFNGRAFHQGASGLFYFGGINGFNYFSPTENTRELIPPKVTITNTFINDKPIHKDSLRILNNVLTLDYFENDLSFKFAVLDYTRPDANQVQFKLEGWDNEYITSSVKNARYSNLPPGNYVMRIRGSNNWRTWGEEETLNVNVLAPFWKTNTFYAGIILVIIGAIVTTTRTYYKQKVKKRFAELEKQHAVLQERERMSKDIHDDLGSGLSTIAILSELARQRNLHDEFAEKQLNKISELARELVANFSELIWSHNPVNDSLQKLLWYIRERLSGMFEGTVTLFTIILPDQISDSPIQAEWRRNVFLATKEALHNVLKHARAHHVELKVISNDKRITITICDDGVGFDVLEKMNTGNGLANMKKRIRACGGELIIETNQGKGCLLTFTVPLVQ